MRGFKLRSNHKRKTYAKFKLRFIYGYGHGHYAENRRRIRLQSYIDAVTLNEKETYPYVDFDVFDGHSLDTFGNAYTNVSDEFLIKEMEKFEY